MSHANVSRAAPCVQAVAAILCMCSLSSGTITFTNNVLTYSSPSDLGTTIDPAGLYNVTASYGVTKASFQALNPQVVAFNGAPAPTPLNSLVVNYATSSTVTFTFAVSYNYGSYTSYNRGAFSGSVYQDAMSTAPNTVGGITDWLDASITSTGGRGVQSLGFCAAFRNDQAVPAGTAIFTHNDGTTGTVTLPALGGSGNPQYVFIGYTAPSGKTITRVQASHTSSVGGAWIAIDDLSFVMSPAGDTTPPAAVSNLSCSNLTTTSVQLNWTAPGDDGNTGTATTYDIRYSTSTITAGNWASATQVSGEPAPAVAGTNQNMVISGLSADTTYYFAIETADKVPNWSGLSNVPSAHTVDSVAPAAVSNLACGTITASSIQLSWTAPGDNGSTGTATTYDIRYSTSAITAGNWANATQVSGEPTPLAAGNNQSMTITGLSPSTTYYFAIETADEVPNWSALSNVPSGTTTAAADTTPPAAVANLSCSNITASSVQLNWTAPGDDGNTGTATTYDIRYSTSAITAGNWASATQVSGEPAPAVAGTNQNMVINGLSGDTTYYFAIETADEVPNWSGLSNVPSAKTSDTVAPAAVTNLSCSNLTTTSVQLNWTAPGDNGSSGTATTYDIRYSTSTITAGNWASATQVSGEPAPAVAGTNQNMVLSGLSPDTTYYFAMETADEVPNWSGLSNVPSAHTVDSVAPAAVTNLATSSPTSSSITLTWTAPGDNGSTGTATTYDIRYSTSTITAGNWASTTQVTGEPAPLAAGNNQSMTVTGLSPSTTYYFAIETADEVPNWSGLSNVPSGTTSSGGSLPAPWQRMDIGAVGYTGTATYSSPTFTIQGSGADIWGTADAFCYVYQSWTGDGTVIARVTGVQNTDPWAKAGVMIRETLTAGSTHAMMVITPGNGASFQWRPTTNGSMNDAVTTGIVAPWYVKLQRSGSNFSAYQSSNGTTWTQVGTTQSITMASSVYVGLCVTAHNNTALCTGTFDNVSATAGSPVQAVVVHNPWFKSDRVADTHNLTTIAATYVNSYTPNGVVTPADNQTKCINIWNNQKRRLWNWADVPPNVGSYDRRDPTYNQNVFGWALCGDHSMQGCTIGQAAGFSQRDISLPGHWIYELNYDGAWHVFDTELSMWVLNKATPAKVASCAEIKADTTLLANAVADGRACTGFLDEGDTVELVPGAINSWTDAGTGAITAQWNGNMDLRFGQSFKRTWESWANQYPTPYTNADGDGYLDPPYCHSDGGMNQDTVNFPYWEPYQLTTAQCQALHIAYTPSYRRWANGTDTLTPDFRSAGYQSSLYSSTNIKTYNDDAQTPDLHVNAVGTLAEAVFKVTLPYYITDATISGSFVRQNTGAITRLYVSTDGSTYTQVWDNTATGTTQLSNLDIRTNVFGTMAYYVKVQLQATNSITDAGVSNLVIATTFEHNKDSMAYLDKGTNNLTFTFDNPSDLVGSNTTIHIYYKWKEYSGTDWTVDKYYETYTTTSPTTFSITVGGTKVPRTEYILVELIRAP